MGLTSSLAQRVDLWLGSSHPLHLVWLVQKCACDPNWDKQSHYNSVWSFRKLLGEKLSLFLWLKSWEEVDLELGAVFRHMSSRERSQHGEKQMFMRGRQLPTTLFKYTNPAVPGIDQHLDFSVPWTINFLFLSWIFCYCSSKSLDL